jgi:hypothetical protein
VAGRIAAPGGGEVLGTGNLLAGQLSPAAAKNKQVPRPIDPSSWESPQYGSTMRILVIGITVLIVILGRLSVMRQREGCGCWMSLLSSW